MINLLLEYLTSILLGVVWIFLISGAITIAIILFFKDR